MIPKHEAEAEMDNFIHEPESDAQDQKSFLAGLLTGRIMNWLASLVKLTEEEQQDAGIYPGRLRDE